MRLLRAATMSGGASPIRETGVPGSIQPRDLASRMASLARPARVFGHLAERAEAEIAAQAGAVQLAPADARQVAGHQSQKDAAASQPFEHRRYAGAVLVVQGRADAQVVALGRALDVRQRLADLRARRSGGAQHDGEDVRIEHALYGNAVGGGVEAGDAADAIGQRLAMMRAGAPDERAVDIEEDQGSRQMITRGQGPGARGRGRSRWGWGVGRRFAQRNREEPPPGARTPTVASPAPGPRPPVQWFCAHRRTSASA